MSIKVSRGLLLMHKKSEILTLYFSETLSDNFHYSLCLKKKKYKYIYIYYRRYTVQHQHLEIIC